MCAYFTELLNSNHSCQYHVVAYGNMTCQCGIVRKYAVVAYFTVMRNMAVSHDEAVAADYCFLFVSGTSVYGNILPDSGVISYFGNSVFSGKLQILWNCRYNRARED